MAPKVQDQELPIGKTARAQPGSASSLKVHMFTTNFARLPRQGLFSRHQAQPCPVYNGHGHTLHYVATVKRLTSLGSCHTPCGSSMLPALTPSDLPPWSAFPLLLLPGNLSLLLLELLSQLSLACSPAGAECQGPWQLPAAALYKRRMLSCRKGTTLTQAVLGSRLLGRTLVKPLPCLSTATPTDRAPNEPSGALEGSEQRPVQAV